MKGIFYILEDDNFGIEIIDSTIYSGKRSIKIYIDDLDEKRRTSYSNFPHEYMEKISSFNEFYDRLEDICNQNNYQLRKDSDFYFKGENDYPNRYDNNSMLLCLPTMLPPNFRRKRKD